MILDDQEYIRDGDIIPRPIGGPSFRRMSSIMMIPFELDPP